jgi:hypothetical protein
MTITTNTTGIQTNTNTRNPLETLIIMSIIMNIIMNPHNKPVAGTAATPAISVYNPTQIPPNTAAPVATSPTSRATTGVAMYENGNLRTAPTLSTALTLSIPVTGSTGTFPASPGSRKLSIPDTGTPGSRRPDSIGWGSVSPASPYNSGLISPRERDAKSALIDVLDDDNVKAQSRGSPKRRRSSLPGASASTKGRRPVVMAGGLRESVPLLGEDGLLTR